MVITVKSFDKQLINRLWSLKSDNIQLQQPFQKDFDPNRLYEIFVYLKEGTSFLLDLSAILMLIKSYKSSSPKKPEVTIVSNKRLEMKVNQLIISYQEKIEIKIIEEEKETMEK